MLVDKILDSFMFCKYRYKYDRLSKTYTNKFTKTFA